MTAGPPIAPVVKTIRVRASKTRAFDAFTGEISTWWPVAQHSLDSENAEAIVLEPKMDGRLYQRQKDGTILDWGHVTGFDRPDRLSLAWHVGRTPQEATRVTVTFADIGDGLAEIILTHDGFEVLDDGEETRNGYNQGWVRVFEECFANAAGGAVLHAAQ